VDSCAAKYGKRKLNRQETKMNRPILAFGGT